jgi:hypothetical protein
MDKEGELHSSLKSLEPTLARFQGESAWQTINSTGGSDRDRFP